MKRYTYLHLLLSFRIKILNFKFVLENWKIKIRYK